MAGVAEMLFTMLGKLAALYLYTLAPHSSLTNSAVILDGDDGSITAGLGNNIDLFELIPQFEVYARAILSSTFTDELI
jgi:hypothetical protein